MYTRACVRAPAGGGGGGWGSRAFLLSIKKSRMVQLNFLSHATCSAVSAAAPL